MKLQLYYPTNDLVITQHFGNINPFYRLNGIPIDGHNGIDFLCRDGDEIRASHSGYAYISKDAKEGIGIVLRTDRTYDYEGRQVFFKTIYWHLKRPLINDGQFVSAGEVIGEADNTGLSTGTHLHFGLKPCLVGETDRMLYNIEQNNGYMGAIDPAPYWNRFYARDVLAIEKIYTKLVPLFKELISLLKVK